MTLPPASAPAPSSCAENPVSRLAALINPGSFRMSLRDRAARSEARINAAGGRAYRVTGLDDIEQALADTLDRGITRIVLAVGDCTL